MSGAVGLVMTPPSLRRVSVRNTQSPRPPARFVGAHGAARGMRGQAVK
jgi:hypothetical protein